jgi:hypothetical protein
MSASIRTQGIAAFAIGTLLETGYLWHLLDEAERGAEEVLVRKSFIFLPIVIASIGLIAMLLGDSATRYLQIDDKKLTFPNLVVLLAPLALSGAVYLLLMSWLSARGYAS